MTRLPGFHKGPSSLGGAVRARHPLCNPIGTLNWGCGNGGRVRRSRSVALVGKELAAHDDIHAVTGWIHLAGDLHFEIDGTHDPVSELLGN
jgi:hypothetical protein